MENHISQELKNFNLPHDRVHLEITETAFLPLTPQTKKAISNIHDLGLKIVLNDFTAGYSTFDYLSRLPFSSLKIAMPLTKRTPTSRMDWKLFRHLVSLGHQLHYDVIAEGVENNELHQLILSTGCNSAQGYFYSHPLPLDDFIALLKQSQQWVNFPYGLMYLAQFDQIDFRRDVIREALIIYNNSDTEIRRRAKTRLPDVAYSDEQFHEWFSMIENINIRDADELAQYENDYFHFYKSCKELLELAEVQVAWDVFENKYREIIELSTKLTESLIGISSACLVRAHKK